MKALHVALLAVFASSAIMAQSTLGTITGLVTDSTSSVVAGATVTVKNIDTGAQATTGEASWNSRLFPLPQWAVPGGKEGTDFLTDTSASTFVSGLGRYTFASTSNLVADVQFWLDNPGSNFGWILMSQKEATASTARRFASREGGTNAPALVIEYTVGQTQPLLISQMRLVGSTVTFQFNVAPQQTYVVEFNNAIGTTNWLTLTNIAAQPGPTNITVSDSVTASHRCYRVKTP